MEFKGGMKLRILKEIGEYVTPGETYTVKAGNNKHDVWVQGANGSTFIRARTLAIWIKRGHVTVEG
jgi:hypothetical protein